MTIGQVMQSMVELERVIEDADLPGDNATALLVTGRPEVARALAERFDIFLIYGGKTTLDFRAFE